MSKVFAGPLPLLGVLMVALALRAWGIAWALPAPTHYFSYHPDEGLVINAAVGMPQHGSLLPRFYNYGSLQIYLVLFANVLAFGWGGVKRVVETFPTDIGQWANMYLIGRSLTVLMGVGTVWVVYALGTRLWGRRAGLLAALVLAVMPLHAQHSHWMTVDVPATFWVTLSLLWTTRLVQGDGRASRAAVWAGVFAGCAAATKYNMALALLPLIVFSLLPLLRPLAPSSGGTGERQGHLRRLALGLGAAALTFLATCPGSFLDWHGFHRDFMFEAAHVSKRPGLTFMDTGNGFVFQIARNLDAGLGLPLLLLALASLVYGAMRRERGDGILAAFALPYYVLISLAVVRYARYALPLLPLLALWSGRFLAALSRQPRPIWRVAVAAGGAAIFLFTLLDSYYLIRPMARPDSRDAAFAWLQAQAQPSAPVALDASPWFQMPPLSPWFTHPQPKAWQMYHLTTLEEAHCVYNGTDFDADLLQAQRPPFVVVSEYDYADHLRLRDGQIDAFLAVLKKDYAAPVIFDSPPPPLGRRKSIDGLPVQDLPHDMLYAAPAILVYPRR